MSRLSHIRGHEIAIQTILDELHSLELHISSGEQLAPQDLHDLSDCLRRLDCLVNASGQPRAQDWETDKEPYPDWLQPKLDEDNRGGKRVAKKAWHGNEDDGDNLKVELKR